MQKKVKNILIIMLLGLISCTQNAKLKKEITSAEKMNPNLKGIYSDYAFLSELKSESGDYSLGHVFIKKINDSVFRELLIVKVIEGGIDTLYQIDECSFSNPNGVDIKVFCEQHFGYQLVSMEKDYFNLISLNRNGRNVSDNITVKWYYDKKLFQVRKI